MKYKKLKNVVRVKTFWIPASAKRERERERERERQRERDRERAYGARETFSLFCTNSLARVRYCYVTCNKLVFTH